MNISNIIAAMEVALSLTKGDESFESWRGERTNNIITRPPAKYSKPHRDHSEWKLSKRERKNRERIRRLSRKKR